MKITLVYLRELKVKNIVLIGFRKPIFWASKASKIDIFTQTNEN